MKNILKLVAVFAVVLLVSNVADAKMLSIGSTGSEVVTLQTWLINNGYPIPLIEKGLVSKGYFGVQTSEAVKMYQEDKNLDLTGVIDSNGYGNTLKLGSVSGPDLYSPYWNVNGVRQWYVKQPMRSATTTICSMRAPTNATSTLHFASFQIVVGTSTAASIDIGTSTAGFATTTNLVAAKSIASGAQGYSYWSPAGGTVNDAKMAPGEYVVVKTAGAGLSGYTYGGSCQAIFIEF